MKNALILHGTGSNSKGNWFPWLKKELEGRGWKVWAPDLPNADYPNIKEYNKVILDNKDWVFDRDSVLIGHSSGAMAILGLLQALPEGKSVDTCILIGSFISTEADPDWDKMKGLFEEPFDYESIKKKARHFVFIHSQDDPYCPPEQAEFLSEKVGGELIMKEHEGHFNLKKSPKYKKFPLVLEILGRR